MGTVETGVGMVATVVGMVGTGVGMGVRKGGEDGCVFLHMVIGS